MYCGAQWVRFNSSPACRDFPSCSPMESIWCVSVTTTITKVASGESLLDPNATIRWSSGARGLPQTCFLMGLTPGTKKYLRDFGSKLGLDKPDFWPECSRLLVVKTSLLSFSRGALASIGSPRMWYALETTGQAGPRPAGYSSMVEK